MKTRVSLFIFCIQMVAVCGFAADKTYRWKWEPGNPGDKD